MAHLEIKVTNSIGSFDGKITLAANSDAASTDKVMREMIGGVNTMKTLSIENDEGGATVFGEGILRESVITVKAVG
jgi:hypothetical protein